MRIVDWYSAELLAVIHMRSLGFADARPTAAGADRGLDAHATDAVAQVKYLVTPVGSADVQRVRGAAGLRGRALFYSLSGYSRQAHEVADVAHVALFTFDVDGTVTPVNELARTLVSAPAGPKGDDEPSPVPRERREHQPGRRRELADERRVRIEELLAATAGILERPGLPTPDRRAAALRVIDATVDALLDDERQTVTHALQTFQPRRRALLEGPAHELREALAAIERTDGHVRGPVVALVGLVASAAPAWRHAHDLAVDVTRSR